MTGWRGILHNIKMPIVKRGNKATDLKPTSDGNLMFCWLIRHRRVYCVVNSNRQRRGSRNHLAMQIEMLINQFRLGGTFWVFFLMASLFSSLHGRLVSYLVKIKDSKQWFVSRSIDGWKGELAILSIRPTGATGFSAKRYLITNCPLHSDRVCLHHKCRCQEVREWQHLE